MPYHTSRELFGRDLDREERSVRGNLVAGLSAEDGANPRVRKSPSEKVVGKCKRGKGIRRTRKTKCKIWPEGCTVCLLQWKEGIQRKFLKA